ncbi:HlyD family secretion protein [Pseudomonas cannabina]|uniref:Secretion protein HlyD protein n=3 Tax=Pseudomonas syringae group TaxID=136849 RepID=A0A3M3RDD9_PSECA|nr:MULTISPECIES: HlyD family secretion protein [Pseudomonas syringae group]KPW19966.1 Secretion protein HlyD family protein [Pseudomonas cannabina pv. alisalensis]MBM0139141.1 HlyD family secretion protein [Pseudomonas cannabina pv. alisalensis]QHE99110.1 HlyD family efflux transporter periplasmic adaptor subunit [Pseudomonas syringae pv. maculicola str. ES4326]QQN21370.1 HlyD family secretion protein [Pseudomonas cannabina pv. alisalensis]RMN78821.1 Secretion protein HlyD protein [Pseudomonas
MKQHRTAISLVCSAVVLCALYSAYHILSTDAVQSTDDAYVRADSVLISARLPGQVTKVLVDDNQAVKAGQILAELDDRDFLVARASAAATVSAAKAQLLNLQASIERQAAVIDQAAATTRATAASLKFAQVNQQRYLNLSNAGAGTQQERQKAESELQSWQASRDRDEASRVAATKTLDVLKAQLEAAKAELAKDQAALSQAELNVSYTRITAPQDGMVGLRSVRVGAYVSQGQPLMAVVPLHEAFVVANFRETQLARMVMNQAVELHVDSIPDHSFRGHIESVAPATGVSFSEIAPDNATGNFTKVVQRIPVKIMFEPNQADLDRLRIGMSVVASVDTTKGH